ncbi:MAG: hypothetical protein O2909_05975 [Chloroflexi bacterium]|nr:hypothetical protein [Chloroflexota bacterium]MDA1218976.1 hypothetical protein [Chloroflexota bacterium]
MLALDVQLVCRLFSVHGLYVFSMEASLCQVFDRFFRIVSIIDYPHHKVEGIPGCLKVSMLSSR